ncbi:Pcc1-domain-containing protein [Mytilinidion resinicola]|uniref:Pcc1-domain-containing protein n=1 Tax=Mytilinidion resinicola TaxID=574789 RepID=A0A6A6Z978_9PEZI|nr:Pcc1-domain-containing protein [Mytilinidion resinicola]KAF2817358.1 Pcc1-domain-containing protein [Mytilinidion resinicola]
MADEFPCKLTLHLPFPTPSLANTALRALAVDQELSPLVRRSFELVTPDKAAESAEKNVLQVSYSATTNRMLRVAVNGFFESVGVVIGVMRELDVDVVDMPGSESLEGAQGIEGVKG